VCGGVDSAGGVEAERGGDLELRFGFPNQGPGESLSLFGGDSDESSFFDDEVDVAEELPQREGLLLSECFDVLLNFLLDEGEQVLVVALVFEELEYLEDSFDELFAKFGFSGIAGGVSLVAIDDGEHLKLLGFGVGGVEGRRVVELLDALGEIEGVVLDGLVELLQTEHRNYTVGNKN
jgi:hypothetical protein